MPFLAWLAIPWVMDTFAAVGLGGAFLYWRAYVYSPLAPTGGGED